MDQKRRRLMLFGTIVLLGMMLTVLEIDPLLLVGGTVGMGVILLVTTGSIRLPRRSVPVAKAAAEPSRDVQKKGAVPEKNAKRSIIPSLHLPSLGLMLARIRPNKKKDNKTRAESIDALLDRALSEPPVTAPGAAVPPAKTATVGGVPAQSAAPADPFMGLSTAQLEEDLVKGIDLDEPAGATAAAPAVTVREPDEVAEILKTSGGDLGDPASLANADALAADLDSLKDVDLGSLDLGAEAGVAGSAAPAGAESPDPAPPAPPPTLPREPPVLPPLAGMPQAEGKSPQNTPSPGGLKGNDDLLSSLKKDMKKVKLGKDPSLVRDLKDTIVHAKDLESDLADILDTLK